MARQVGATATIQATGEEAETNILTMMMLTKTVMIIWWESCVEAASELLSHRGSFTMEGGRQKQ